MGYVGSLRSEISREVGLAIVDVENAFRENPLDYTIEAAITTDILERLRAEIGTQISARAGYLPGPPANYKEGYLNTLSRGQSIRNIQPEVNIGISSHFDGNSTDNGPVFTEIDANNARIDIGILEPRSHPLFAETKHPSIDDLDITANSLEVCIAKGSKYFPPESVTHAIEVKYIKDKTSPGSGLDENPPRWHKVDGDIKKLELLATHGSGGKGAECHLILASNMNLFQVGIDERDPEYRSQFRRRLENLVQYCERQEDREPIHVWDIHPPRA